MIKVENKKVEKLIEYENNARINDKAVEVVANSIREFGFKNPVIIDSGGVIIAGHTRVKACKKLGIEEVPCIIADDLTDEQIKAFRLADNSTAQVADWDMEKLQAEIDAIDFDMSAFGLKEELKKLSEMFDRNADEDNYERKELVPKIALGEVWQLGNNRLMCGDSTDIDSVNKLMNNETADMIMTDPPYNVAYESSNGKSIANDNMSDKHFLEFLTKAFDGMFKSLKNGGSWYIWYASREHINFEKAVNSTGNRVRQQLVWNKNQMILGRSDYQWKHELCLYGWKDGASHYFVDDRTQTTVLKDKYIDFKKLKKEEAIKMLEEIYSNTQSTIIDENKPYRNDDHPTMKPIKLMSRLIKNSSKQGELVLDIFGGSGSTLIACEQLNRRCNIMELDPKYATVIIDRWENLTGETAVRIK